MTQLLNHGFTEGIRKVLFLLIFVAFHPTLSAQKARVFEHFTPAFAFGDNASVPSISYTQSLALGKKFGFRVNSGIRITQYIVRSSTEIPNTVVSKSRTLTLAKNAANTAINIPVGVEIGNRFLAIGINADLIGVSLPRSRDRSTFVINNGTPPEGLSTVPQGFNFLITQSGTLNSQVYVAVTPNQNLALKLGMAYTQTRFKTTFPDTEDPQNVLPWDSFIENAFRPFVGLQFNFEK
jgi:hypothetical protein